MEYNPESITTHGKNCVGCKENQKDVMITFADRREKPVFVDVFLTNKEAGDLIIKLQSTLRQQVKGFI